MAINCDGSLRYNRNLLVLSLMNNAICGREGYNFRNFRNPLNLGIGFYNRNYNNRNYYNRNYYGKNYYGRNYSNMGVFNNPVLFNDLWYFYNTAFFNNPLDGNDEE